MKNGSPVYVKNDAPSKLLLYWAPDGDSGGRWTVVDTLESGGTIYAQSETASSDGGDGPSEATKWMTNLHR